MILVKENLRLQRVVILAAIILFIIKIIAWFLTSSLAILTDALESIVNIVAAFLGFYSLNLSAKPKDADHPYGHGKVEFLSAGVEGSLVIMAGFYIIYKAVQSFFYPHTIAKLDFGIFLVGFTAIVNFILGKISVRTGKRNHSLQLIASGKHLITDTYSTCAIVVSLAVIYFTGYTIMDSLIACIVAMIIIYTGYRIVRVSIAGIMDEADDNLLKEMVVLLNKNRKENWIDLHNTRIIKYGSRLHCDCHLTVPWYLNVNEAHQEVESLTSLIKDEFKESVEFFVHSDGCKDFSCNICSKHNCLVRKHPFERRIEWAVANISTDSKHDINTVY